MKKNTIIGQALKNAFFIIAAMLATATALQAQDDTSPLFTVEVSADTIAPGDVLTVTFTLEGAQGKNFKAPSFAGTKRLGGPSQSSRMSITNGQVSQSISYEYYITAEAAGEFIIGTASIEANGKTLETPLMVLQAVDGFVGAAKPEVSEQRDPFGFDERNFFPSFPSLPEPVAPAPEKKKRKTYKL